MIKKILNKIDRAMALPFIVVLYVYSHYVTLLFMPRCRFYPSCSRYALDALYKLGFTAGLFYSIKRLVKCHPWHAGGFDPLPNHHKPPKDNQSSRKKECCQ